MIAENQAALWSRLQAIANAHGAELARDKTRREKMPRTRGGFSADSFIVTDWDLRETCDILGRGDAEEICGRIHWYLTYLPNLC